MQNESELTSLSRDTSLGQYKLREVLDTDKFSITYNAWDTKRYRLLLIKEYFPNKFAIRDDNVLTVAASDGYKDEYQEGLERFLDTAKIIATFNHPNIETVLDYFQLNNTAYLCMPHEQGQTLDKLLIQKGSTLPEQELKPILIATLSALQYAHNHNFYPASITLDDIFIRTQGELFIIKFDNNHQAINTNPNDVSLEKNFTHCDSWQALHAVGSIMYQCISGQQPIDISSRQTTIAKNRIDSLIPASEAGRNQYSEEFLELIDWMQSAELNNDPDNIDKILDILKNGITISNMTALQSDIAEDNDKNKNQDDINPIPVPLIVPTKEQKIPTDHSEEISVTSPPPLPKAKPDSSSFSTILWLVITGTIVFALILLGLSLQQPLHQIMSNKNGIDHQLDSKNIKPKKLSKKTIKENLIGARLGESTLQKNNDEKQETTFKQHVEIIKKNRVNKETGEIKKPHTLNSTSQKTIAEQQFKTFTQSPIKKGSVEQTETLPSQLISSLLTKAKIDIKQLRLTTPKNNNALEKYQKILQLEPNNRDALHGLTLITEKYLHLVKIKQQQQNYGIARRYLNKAKMIHPDNPAIIEAENRLIGIESSDHQSQTSRSTSTKTPPEIKMVWISPACFQMGDNEIYASEHEVCLTRGYYLGKYEVTQSQWHQVMNNTPSVSKRGNNPIENISWNEVQTFIRKLNDLTGKHYRLPTEAEWEYACRNGGKNIKYCGSNNANRVAWYKDNSDSKIHPVGQKQPNGLGLYDMSGNVWEWVQDWYKTDYYSNSPIDNPKGPFQGTGHVVRGGSWFSGKNVLRSAYRVWYGPNIHVSYLGFRLAR